MKKNSLYFRTAVVGLAVGMALGLSACGTEKQPEIDLNESENLEDGGLYIEEMDESDSLQEPQVEESQEPDTEASGMEVVEPETVDTPHAYVHTGMFDDIFAEKGDANLMYSPLSLDYVVGMLYQGASDEVKASIDAYLRDEAAAFTQDAGIYMDGLPESVQVSNAMFVNGTGGLNADTEQILKDQYHAGIEALDFLSPDAVARVDAWCNENTNGLITHLFDDMSEMDAAVVNALYFHQDWEEQITDDAVWADEFKNEDGSTSSVDMVHFKGDGYVETSQGEGFVKYYEGGRYCFIGMIPKEDREFTMQDIDLYMAADSMVSGTKVNVVMPEFTIESDMGLNDVLKGAWANLEIMFDESAFPGFLADGTPMGVTSVIQKTKIIVDRKGTEAAAVTGAAMETMAALPEDSKLVELNRPFAFMIYDCESGQPLFMGKVTGL